MGLRRCEWQRKLRLRGRAIATAHWLRPREGTPLTFPMGGLWQGHCVPSMPPTLPAASCPTRPFSEELDAGPCSL